MPSGQGDFAATSVGRLKAHVSACDGVSDWMLLSGNKAVDLSIAPTGHKYL
jgi:hypothetical protein